MRAFVHVFVCIYMYVYIYIYMCVCMWLPDCLAPEEDASIQPMGGAVH